MRSSVSCPARVAIRSGEITASAVIVSKHHTDVLDRGWRKDLGLPFRIQALLNWIFPLNIRKLLCSSSIQSDCSLFNPFQRFLAWLDNASYSHPIFRSLAGYDIASTVDWLSLESSHLTLRQDYLFSLEMALENISVEG
jgi:hypothetical protein